MKTLIKVVATALFIACTIASSHAQKLNSNWESILNQALETFKNCQGDACRDIHGKNLKAVYNLNDFYNSSTQQFMTIDEINNYVQTSGKWEKIGPGYDDQALAKAQEMANNKKAAVAIYLDDQGLGHMALILPGTLTPSGSWGMQVPNAASFSLSEPSTSFVGKSLSYAFRRSQLKDLTLYARK